MLLGKKKENKVQDGESYSAELDQRALYLNGFSKKLDAQAKVLEEYANRLISPFPMINGNMAMNSASSGQLQKTTLYFSGEG